MVTVNGMRAESISFKIGVSAAKLQSALRDNILPAVGTKDVSGLNGIRENDIELVAHGWLIMGRFQQWIVQIYANEIQPGVCEVELVAIADKAFTVFMRWGSGQIVTLGKSIAKRDEIANAIKNL